MNHQILGRLLLLAIIVPWVRLAAQSLFLGVLEENPGHYFGEPKYRTVRVVFEKRRNEWQAFPSECEDQACSKTATSAYPSEVKWTITFNGRNLGEVVSRTPNDFRWYSDVGQQVITSKTAVPTVGSRSPQFGGYSGEPLYRPLVANSKEYFTDPDQWKPFVASPESTDLLRQSFRNRFPKLCSGSLVARLHLKAVECQDANAGFDLDAPWFFVDRTN